MSLIKSLFLALSILLTNAAVALPLQNISFERIPRAYSEARDACAVSFYHFGVVEPAQVTMTYHDGRSGSCPYKSAKVLLTCAGFLCHSGDEGAYRGSYQAVYYDRSGTLLMVRTNHCHGSCQPFDKVQRLPLPAENANFQAETANLN